MRCFLKVLLFLERCAQQVPVVKDAFSHTHSIVARGAEPLVLVGTDVSWGKSKAVAVASADRMEDALPVFEGIFRVNDNWHTMVQRLPASGLLNIPKEEMARIVNLN